MKSPAYQFYPDKWQTDTRRLSWEAKGIYHELLCVVWLQFQDTCSIPDDDGFIAAEIGCEIGVWQRVKAELLNPHRPILERTETNRLLINGLLKEAVKQADRRESLRANGSLGGRPKNQKVSREVSEMQTLGNLNESLPSPSPSPSPAPSPSPKEDKKADKPPQLTDSEFLEALKANPAYSGIDVAREHGKAQAWCMTNRKQCTRRFFVNWINRVEKPMAASTPTKHVFANGNL